MFDTDKVRNCILTYLEGFEMPVPRKKLNEYLAINGFVMRDSCMRREVQKLAEAGIVGSTHRGKNPGYFIINNIDEAKTAARERRNKAFTELKIANTIMTKASERFGGQRTLFEIVESK